MGSSGFSYEILVEVPVVATGDKIELNVAYDNGPAQVGSSDHLNLLLRRAEIINISSL